MNLRADLSGLTPTQVEEIERLSMQWLYQAVRDFGMEAYRVFHNSPDDVKDVAEDVTREILDRLPGFNLQHRVYGTVDYKKARYIVLTNEIIRQALFVDSKAEQTNSSATLQLSQTSMSIRQNRSGETVDIPGLLQPVSVFDGLQFLTTTLFIHYRYSALNSSYCLHECTLCALPNGLLQNTYNPSALDTIWIAGRNAPSLGEDFRVRLSFARLKAKAGWRVQRIVYDARLNQLSGQWDQ